MTESFRLPTDTIPSHYHIRMRPDLESETFQGTVTIRADVQASTNIIVLNSDSLEISDAKVATEVSTAAANIVVNQSDEQVELHLNESLPEGPVTIDLSFSGSFNPQLVGLYASHFQIDGVDHKLATTQFEATHARKCFPCWDEPAFKATFKLDLIIDDQYDAIANSAEQSRTSNGDGTSTISFAPTMKMSTYLVAFVVGPLEKSKVVTAAGIPLRVVHVPGKSELTDFALEVGAFALEYFTEYFGIDYPGDKLDLVAIPDFAFGAMENLGCVTFREVLLLIDPESSTQPELMRSVDVINHELAHMWFGDLVTMKWWNGLWLNEAFATFMEMKCTEAFRPDWERWVEFGVSRSQAFATDSLVNTRPIEFEVIHPEDADGMFDILTYEKGAAVVRMAEQFLGEADFQAGIAQYIAHHSYGNTETTDLWDSLQASTGRPVRKMMDSWIFQRGYPAISSQVDDTTLTISQERLLYTSNGSDSVGSQIWSVPIQYRWLPAGASEPVTEWMLLEDDVAEVTLPSEPEWVILNANSSSFIRVSRTTEQLDDLADISADHLTPLERYSLIDDTWAAVLSGSISTLSFLTLLEAMVGETNRSVWSRIVQGLNQLDRLVDGPAQTGLEDIAHDILSPALASLGLGPVEGDSDKTKQLRGDLVRAFGITANNKEIQEEAQRAVATEGRNPGTVDISILAAAVEIVAYCGDETDFDEFTNRWRTAETPQAELRYLGALCDFQDDALIARLRTRILDGDVRSQNGPYMLRRALMNQEVNAQTWEFIKQNWDQLNNQFPTTSIVRMVDGITTLTSEAQLADTTEFFDQHPVTTGQQTLQQILERQEVNVRLVARERQKLSDFLNS